MISGLNISFGLFLDKSAQRYAFSIKNSKLKHLILRGCFIISVKTQAKKFEMDLSLRRRSIAVAM